MTTTAFYTICNYEQVLRDVLAIEKIKWDLIIIDEAQRIKNWEAKTSQTIKALKSPFALALSGTPLENRLEDLFSVVEFIDDRRLGPAFRFYNRHRVVDERGKLLGYKNLDEVREEPETHPASPNPGKRSGAAAPPDHRNHAHTPDG